VIAAIVPLLDRSLVRIGNGQYARKNGPFGVTTLRYDLMPPEET
jgi:DNA topoisomerase IB